MLKVRSQLGKYRIVKRLAEGGFAYVYQARDTVSGVPVALKIPHKGLVDKDMLDAFRKEVQLTARLDHPNILPVRDAGTIDGIFYVASPLGIETLADRLSRRLASRTMVTFAAQMIAAVAHAHHKRIMHCDIKPENFILFPENRVRLADFGIAKVALRTLAASGSGTVGYVAPEQAMGKPSLRSDVFSLGLVLYRMFSGWLPHWPYEWPMIGHDKLVRCWHQDLVDILRRALEVDDSKRFRDALAMERAFARIRSRAIRRHVVRRAKKSGNGTSWKTVRWRAFQRQFRAALQSREECHRCQGPMAETMNHCPWCGTKRRALQKATRFPKRCPRCRRGIKSDWRFCPWCYGVALNPEGYYRYQDQRYSARCSNSTCPDKLLMPFMRYCPWCRRKVQNKWKIEGATGRCSRCGWGVVQDYWDYCPWCAKRLR